ncbi:hypothetical protein KEM52_001823, partial [Ascosphaera acerosa]
MSLTNKNNAFDYEAYSSRLKRITLPEKLKCKRCDKIRNTTAFSKRQLLDLKSKLAMRKKIDYRVGAISCQECTASQTVEMTCALCDKTKGLECFSKAQRKDPDTAGNLDAAPAQEGEGVFDDESTAFGST